MLLWLFLTAATAAEPGAGLELPPEGDPVARWTAITLLVVASLSPLILAKIQKDKPVSNVVGAPPLAAPDSATPRLDVSQEILNRWVETLKDHSTQDAAKYEARLAAAEAKNQELDQRLLTLLDERATAKAQIATLTARVESISADNVEIRADNVELRAEIRALRGRLNG